jgi:hypothetical protein
MSRSLRDAGVLIAAKLPVLFDIAVRWMGPLLVLLAWALFGAVTHVYFNDILPVMGLSPFALPGSLWTVLGLFLLFNLVYNHLGAVLVSPGFVPDSLVSAARRPACACTSRRPRADAQPNPPNFDQIFKEEVRDRGAASCVFALLRGVRGPSLNRELAAGPRAPRRQGRVLFDRMLCVSTHQAAARAPLPCVQPLCAQNGPPLP